MLDSLGVVAALVSPLAMTIGFFVWGEHWKGSAFSLNLFKCTLASSLFLLTAVCVDYAEFMNAWSKSESVNFILLSSFLGILIGDNLWLLSLQMIGAKKVIVIDCLKPFLAAIFGLAFLNEPLQLGTLFGLFFSTIGVYLVCDSSTKSDADADENNSKEHVEKEKTLRSGYMLAAANVVLDAYGSVLTKQFGVDFNTFEINFMRFGFASFVMAAIAIIASIIHKFYPGLNNQGPVLVSDSDTKFRELTQTSTHNALHHDDEEGHVQENAESPSYESSPDDKSTKLLWWQMPNEHIMNTKSWVYSSIGVIFVTFLCPALSNWALFRIPLGVCLTLTSVGPIYSLPLSVYVKKEAISPKGTIGAILAVAGVAILCFI